MRKFFLLLLFVILCGQYLVYGQRGFDSLPESSIHIKFGDPIVFTPVEGAESYRFLFSLYGHVDTIQTTTPYISASEYTGMPLFETYDITMQYYKNSVWHVSEESNRVMIVTDSGTDFLIHDMIKAGQIPSATSSDEPEFDLDTADIIYIPIVYHVIVPSWFNGEPTEYLNPAKINQSMDILNKVFAGETGELGVDTKIRFRPALTDSISYCEQNYYGITYNVYNGENINLDTSVIHPGNVFYSYHNSSSTIPRLADYYTYFPSDRYINIWVFDNIIQDNVGVYGITSSPCLRIGNPPILAITKGVCGENPNIPSKQLGYTVAHEMGHYFGLWHAWIEREMRPTIIDGQLVITPVDVPDYIDDTPDYPGPVLGCDYSGLDTIPYDNIMSYTSDGCRYRFTIGQANRMRRKIYDIFSDYVGAADTASILPDILGVRIVSPGSYICGNSDFDIKLSTYDISVFQRLEISMIENSNSSPLVFNNSEFVQEGELYVKHVHLEQPLPTGEYNFTLYTGENGCTSISKRFNFIDCNNSIDSTQAQWYFDSYVTLDFRSGIAQLGEFSAMDADDSESGICDESGNILFYTDGDRIWNGNHELINSLNQHISYKGTIVLKFDETHCAVVSICNNGQLVSRLIEHGQSFNISAYIYEGPYFLNGLTAVPCPTGGYWLISTANSNEGFVSIKLRFDGTSLIYENNHELNINTNIPSTNDPISLKASPNGKYIVRATSSGFNIAYFNATHGTFEDIDCEISFTSKRSSPAFSHNGRFLYLSYTDLTNGDDLVIMQYDLNNDYSCNCQGIIGNEVLRLENRGDNARTFRFLQEGPDGRIYISRVGDSFGSSKRIGVIMEPDNLASTFNGYEDCFVVEDLIDYEPGSILQNWDNLPNLVDAKDIDTCAASFTICSSDCSLESLTLHNFSLSPSLTWSFYDLSGNLITTDTAVEPELSSITELYNRNAFIIKQTTACEGHYMIDTVSFDAQMQIVGPDSICIDGSSYIYSTSLEPHNQINRCEWAINSELNGDYYYDENLRYSDLMIRPEALDCEFTISCNIMDKYGCRDTAELSINAKTDCSFVANVTQECNSGKILLSNNACNVDMANYNANIIINGEAQPMELDGDIFVYRFMDSNEEHNANIIVTDDNTDSITEIDVLIPSTIPSIYVERIISPALCANDLCYVSVVVSNGELSHIDNTYVINCNDYNNEYNSDDNNIQFVCCTDTLPNGDLAYIVAIIDSTPAISDKIFEHTAYISWGGESCDTIKPISLPYQRIEPTFYISHSDVCHEGGSGTIAIEMELPRIDNYPYMSTIWNFGNNEVETYFVPSHGSTYTTILDNNNAQGINIGQGSYTPTIQYSQICYETLTPIDIDVLSPEVQEPEIEVLTTYACSNMDNGTITIEILSGVEEGFDPYVIWNGGTHISEFELSPDSTRYTTTWNAGTPGNYSATVFYTSSCAETLYTSIQRLSSPHFNISHTEICNVSDTASITVEMELANTDNGFTPYAYWNNGEQTYFALQEGSNTIYTTTLNNIGRGLYSADVYYTSYCSTPLPTIVIDVSNINVSYDYVSENSVGIHLHFTPPANNYIVSVAGHEEDTINGYTYNFAANSRDTVEIITPCDTIPLDFRVFGVSYTDSLYGPCQKIETQIRFTISGGSAPYTATFTNGDYTNTMTINNVGSVVMNVEIMQGEANHLTVVSASGDTYNINLGTIDFIANYAVLETSSLGATYNGGTYIVPTGLTFDHDVTFTNCTIYCAYTDYDDITSTQWTVNSGNTVTFNQCTIKSGCPDKMWQGIKVKGETFTYIDPPFPPLPNDPPDGRTRALGVFGKVICDNTAIEDAIKAVESTQGGKIIANGSHFNNNQYDLYYNSYSIAQGSANTPTITNCTFSTTRLLNDNSIFPEAHICLNGVRGIYVDNCTFVNSMPYSTSILPEIGTPYYTDRRGIGISSAGSNLQTVSTNTFNGLYYAVHASGLGTIPVQVTNCIMNNVFRGIYINDNNGCIVQDNDITCQNSNLAFIPQNPSGNAFIYLPEFALKSTTPYGAYLNSCTGFTFEHNTIKRAGTGLYVNNSGGDDNRVENNIFGTAFNGNTNGMVAIGKNSNFVYNGGLEQSGNVGLQALCNVFTGNSYDFGVYSGNMRIEQGTEANPAGNQFYKNSINLSPTHKQFTTQGLIITFTYGNNAFTYYEHYDDPDNDINNYYRELKSSHYDYIEPINTYERFDATYCDCEVPTGPILPPLHPVPFPINPLNATGNTITNELQVLNSGLTTKVEELSNKIDDGNTEMALEKAMSITPTSNITIDDFSTDGYISDTVSKVLKSKIEEKPVAITSVFIENSPLPAETYEEVMETDISSVLKYVLSYYQSGETKCARDKKEIARISQEIGAKEKILYLSAMYDTTETGQYEIADVFASQESVAGKSKAFDILMKKDDFLGAADVVTGIRSLGTDAASKYADIAERCIELSVNPDTAKIRLRGEREFLLQLIADNSYLYSGKAMTLYKFAFDTILPDYTPMFEDVIAPKSKSAEAPQLPNIFTLYPNPTTGLVTVIIDRNEINDEMIEFLEHYGMQDIEDCENVTVSILDSNGRMLQTQEFNYEEEITLNIGNYVPGAYIVEIRSCFSDVFSTKIIKM